jgi:hypothetical protein
MDYLIVGVTAFLASGLTLYSGFGLGTVLLPAFALFFPAETAVAATGAVHLLNNMFKGGLLRRTADWRIVMRFGLPTIPAAILGAWVLAQLGKTGVVYDWSAFGRVFRPSGAGLAIGTLMILFALLELQPWFQRLAAPPRLVPLGGLLTGFVGGLSGQQGALRSMFLLKSGLDPQHYIATGVMIAIIIDLSRLPTYAASFSGAALGGDQGLRLIAIGTLCAFAGAWIGARYARKATVGVVRAIVAALMLAIGMGLILGFLGA